MKYIVTFGGNYFLHKSGDVVRDFSAAEKFNSFRNASDAASRINRMPKHLFGQAVVLEAEVNHKLITVKVYYDVIKRRKSVRG